MDDRTMRRISEAKSGHIVGTAATETRYGGNKISLNLTGAIDV
jgi:hypothetical protein